MLDESSYVKESRFHRIFRIIAKVENAEGIQNIDETIRKGRGVMAARVESGVEIPG